MNKHTDICMSDDVISLYDIWKKLVQYKNVFWFIFFATFIIGESIVLLTPPKYTFSQVIEVGKSPDEKGQNIMNVNMAETITKIKKVFLPTAIRLYNSKSTKKIHMDEKSLAAENAGNGALLLSMSGQLKDLDRCKFILHSVVECFSNETKEYIDYRKKILGDTKINLERRLLETNNFHKAMTEKYFAGVSGKKSLVSLESRIITMYLNDQNAVMVQLSNSINMLQAQIIGTYNSRPVSDLIVSDQPVEPSKFVLLILVVIASLFFSCFGVFVMNYLLGLRKFKG